MARPVTASRLAATALLAALIGPTLPRASEFFGPAEALQIQPELDTYLQLGDSFRLLLQVPGTLIPEAGYSDAGVFAYASWFLAPIVANFIGGSVIGVVNPDVAKTRILEFRLGAGYAGTTAPGTVGWSRTTFGIVDATQRVLAPGAVLVAWRNRYEGRWALDGAAQFSFRLRSRLQLERDIVLSREAGTLLTPYANIEFIWSSTNDMWNQFRALAGLQLTVHWFGRGQVFEVNGGAFVYLQPQRSYSPVIAIVYSQYFD